MRGLVIKNTGSWYTVKTDDGQLIESKIKGNFRLKGIRSTNPVAVGDYVQLITNQEGTAFISSIEDRQNYIIRKSPNLSKQSHILAANVDQALLVVTVNYPQTSTTFIDRFLAGAEAYRVPVIIIFNKSDILSEEELHYEKMMCTLYETIGYKCIELSAATGEGVELLRPLIKDKKSLLSGNSGVGKSTEGTVLNQDPVGGSEVSAGTTINVIVAGTENVDFTDSESQSEQNNVPVPNVVGKLEKDASSTLSAAGFKVSKTYKYDDSVDAGKVVSQSPRGGNAQEGSTVTIVISQGKKSSTVPSVQGHSKKDAQAALQKAGLKVAVKEEYSDSVKAGQVISQSVASGKIVPADTTVTITVSKGPEEINYSYKFSKSYAAPEGAVSATYTLTGSDGTTYASGTSDVDGSLTIGASDMACESGKVTITWSIEKIDDEGLSDTSTKTETHSVSFSKQ